MKKIAIILSFILLCSFSVHKYYLALTEIEYNEKTKSVQMIMNVFMDDIETAINKDYVQSLQLASTNETKNVDALFYQYLQEHFKISINNQAKEYKFIGKEYDGNIVYFYLEIENVNNIQSIDIQNTILINHFPEQKNLVKAKVNNIRKSLFLTKKNDKGLLNF